MKALQIKKPKKGSSSVLIILIMLCLTVFGVLSVVSAYSDYRLAAKNNDSHKSFYSLDAHGEAWLADVDAQLKSLWDAAGAYAQDEEFLAASSTLLPGDAQELLRAQFAGGARPSDEVKRDVQDAVYLYLVAGIQLDTGSVYTMYAPEDYLSISEPPEPDIEITAELTAPDDVITRYLTVSLRPVTDGARFEVTQWQLWAESFEYEQSPLDLWDGGSGDFAVPGAQ